MKVLFDHQVFTGAKYGGIARYFYDLIRNLKNEKYLEVELALKFSNTEYLKDNSLGKFRTYEPFLGTNLTNKSLSHLNRLYSATQIGKKQFDIFHPTFYNAYFLPFLGNKPFVLTYHDVIPEKFHQQYAQLDGFDKNQKQKLLDKATKIIAVSENTKQDLLDIFKVSEDKIDVVWHSTHFNTYTPSENFKINTPKNYLLYVGNRDYYKNFKGFVRGVSPLLKKHPDIFLVCAGSSSFNKDELNIFVEEGVLNQIEHFKIENDDVLYRLYQNAIAFIYPSLYEGFGIPILEAFACGCPVILSNRSSFPEVAQDAALYFNPSCAEEMNHKIERILLDSTLRSELVQKGYERLKKFSSQLTAIQTFEVYKDVIS